jgi:CO dehydrogenase/CO-methylating acetyl-CoA synthase complex beta subunit/CO dehydrogenase/acetyl-CoA synthase delta subunit
VPIPVPYGAAFEGERIRKQDVHVEFGGNRSSAFEYVTMVEPDAISDGVIDIVGPDIDTVAEGSVLPLGIWVEVAGRKMQPDFEPILERQIHHLVNGAEGIWHMGQRDIVWTRVSKSGFAKGLRLRHYGEILHARFLADYPAIVDKVKVTLITDAAEVERRQAVARNVYRERNRRLESMTDDSVDIFYSCLLCQSFAPNHVCIITPERLGLCGAYNWLDGKAAFEIDETGPNQPVKKGECLDPRLGIWKGINDYTYQNSHRSVESVCVYSMMDRPMTSCGCFEAICAYLPECNGVMVVNREYTGETPVGMNFSTLAGSVGGGQQTPGFMGIGKVFLTSRKFLSAEGGHGRIVWMPKGLKEQMTEDLRYTFERQGLAGLLDKIADESVAVDAAAVRRHMEKVQHPALAMPDMSQAAQSRQAESASPGAAPAPQTAVAPQLQTTSSQPGLTDNAALMELLAQSAGKYLSPELAAVLVGEVGARLRGEVVPQAQTTAKSSASDTIHAIRVFPVRREQAATPVWTVKLGATAAEGGTRGAVVTIGGHTCMPFHLWEGRMGSRPAVAMEVFDTVSAKYPQVLRDIYGSVLASPADMAALCVEKFGAELISVRLDATHPERGGRRPEQAVETVKSVLAAVKVPLIVTGHNHFDTNNEVLKAVAQACSGENLLLNWVEQDNYRTIAGAALAYGHCLVAQSPIDVNIAKQLSILLTSMNVPAERIVIDPMTGATGYGIEYTYSVMERIRTTGLSGDAMLAAPMIVCPGQECSKTKEYKASQADFPAWGVLESRAAMWELTTAVSLVYAGADVLVMYHPDAARALRDTIDELMDN